MRAVIQRVASADVEVDGKIIGSIGPGLLVLAAVHKSDSESAAEWLAQKIVALRLFKDDEGRMNLSVQDIGGEILIVSQFTLYADCRRGRRPSYGESADPEKAKALYDYFVKCVRSSGIKVEEGQFRAHMKVRLLNDGPVTVIVDTPEAKTEA